MRERLCTGTTASFRHKNPSGDTFALHEVYYDEAGKPAQWTDEPECGHFDSVEELIEAIEQMLRDAKLCAEDILDFDAQLKGHLDAETS